MPGCSDIPLNISECSTFLVSSTALKRRPKHVPILRFNMDEGCFELRSHQLVLALPALNYRNNNCAEYLAYFRLKVFSIKLFGKA